jgi:hypothetical protein
VGNAQALARELVASAEAGRVPRELVEQLVAAVLGAPAVRLAVEVRAFLEQRDPMTTRRALELARALVDVADLGAAEDQSGSGARPDVSG